MTPCEFDRSACPVLAVHVSSSCGQPVTLSYDSQWLSAVAGKTCGKTVEISDIHGPAALEA